MLKAPPLISSSNHDLISCDLLIVVLPPHLPFKCTTSHLKNVTHIISHPTSGFKSISPEITTNRLSTKRTRHGQATDNTRTGYGLSSGISRTQNGRQTDTLRTGYGQPHHGHKTGGKRTHYGQDTGNIRAIDGRRTSAGLRGSLVERARLCSSVVRSAFGRFLCGVRLVLVRVAFVRGGRSRGGRLIWILRRRPGAPRGVRRANRACRENRRRDGSQRASRSSPRSNRTR